jgi:MerR family transcriptional regulator, light-induced transcriptional regulator
MNRFSIKDIENLTGIRSHTLRIWEQRYGIPQPKRTATNIRYYDDADLRLLLNVSMLNRQGHKISKLTCLNKDELEKLALSYALNSSDISLQLDTMLAAMFNLDEGAFDKILSTHLVKHGLEKTMTELFFPFMKRIGVLWQTGQVNPSYEHFMSNLIRQKMIVAIDSQHASANKDAKKFLLFLPENETHELGLLFGNYIIRSRGHNSVYLGQNLPYNELDPIVLQYQPQYIMSVVTSSIDKLSERFKKQKILLSGNQLVENKSLSIPSNIKIVASVDEFISFVDNC